MSCDGGGGGGAAAAAAGDGVWFAGVMMLWLWCAWCFGCGVVG